MTEFDIETQQLERFVRIIPSMFPKTPEPEPVTLRDQFALAVAPAVVTEFIRACVDGDEMTTKPGDTVWFYVDAILAARLQRRMVDESPHLDQAKPQTPLETIEAALDLYGGGYEDLMKFANSTRNIIEYREHTAAARKWARDAKGTDNATG